MGVNPDFIVGADAERIEVMHAELADALRGEVEPERAAALVAQLAIAAAQAATGVCRREHSGGGYADLVPILDDDGLRYCCTGDPQNCSSQIAT